jgi:hypothetical protein
MSVTMGMVAVGWTDDEIFETLLRYPGGASLLARLEKGWSLERTRSWFEKYTLAKAKARCVASPTVRSQEDAQPTIDAARRWAAARIWKGAAGNTDRVVLAHLLDLAQQYHRIHGLGASNRQVAEATGITHPTARASLKRLADVGILRRLPLEEVKDLNGYGGPLAHRYSICTPTLTSEEEQAAWEGRYLPSQPESTV